MNIKNYVKKMVVSVFIFIGLLFAYIALEMWSLGGVDNMSEHGWFTIVNSFLLLFPTTYLTDWIFKEDDRSLNSEK